MAQLTITVPDSAVPRILEALNVTTAAEVRLAIIDFLKSTVRNYEITRDLRVLETDYETARQAYVPPADVDAT